VYGHGGGRLVITKMFGLEVTHPRGWEVRAFRRSNELGKAYPVVHAASFVLPRERGDFGAGAVERMGPRDVFVALFEYGPDAVGTALFNHRRPTSLVPEDFSTLTLQVQIAGHSGHQSFFTDGGRPFCLYAVLGSHRLRATSAPIASRFVSSLQVYPRPGVEPGPSQNFSED
jgi:hypothetical protein